MTIPRNCTADDPGDVGAFVADRSIGAQLQEVCEGMPRFFGEDATISASVVRPPPDYDISAGTAERMTFLALHVRTRFTALESLRRLHAFQDEMLYPLFDRENSHFVHVSLADVPDELDDTSPTSASKRLRRSVAILPIGQSMAEDAKIYRGLRRSDDDKKVETQRGPLLHPTEPDFRFDWPFAGEGSLWLAEALLADAADADLSAAHAEEYAAEWVGELPLWSGPMVDESWRLLGPEEEELMDEVLRETRIFRSLSEPPPVQVRQDASEFVPPIRFLGASSPEEARRLLHQELFERYHEDWRVGAPEVSRWAHGRADTHAEVRRLVETGGGLLLIDLYGPLSRRFREIAEGAGRGGDVVPLGGWPDAPALNLLRRPDWISPEDLAGIVASAAAEVWDWSDARTEDAGREAGEEWDDDEREEALAPALLEDALLSLILANDALGKGPHETGSGEASGGRYTLFDVQDLLMPPAESPLFPGLLPLLGDVLGASGDPLAEAWERWRALPAEVMDARARPILSARESFRGAPWARSFASEGGTPLDLRGVLGGGKIVLADLSGHGRPGSASEVAELVLLRLFAWGAAEPDSVSIPHAGDDATLPAVFLPGALREDRARLRRRGGRVAMAAMEACLRGLDVRPC